MRHLLDDTDFQQQLAKIASQQSTSFDKVCKEAEKYLDELETERKPIISSLAVKGTQYVLSRAYEKTIDVNPVEIKEVSKLMRRHSVAFVMTHKTYIDMMVLGAVLARHGLPIPHIFAGINMNFLGVGQLGRNTGVIFIRRDIKDNPVYKVTLRKYIAELVKQKADFMWAIEGTRSRTGKLVWPKMGILKYILEGEKLSGQEVKYIPVSTVYDLIPDVQAMTEEGRGKSKNPESLMWFIEYLRKMGNGHGKISLRFGAPVEMGETHEAELPLHEDDHSEKYTLPRFAFQLVHKINQITPVTTASLVCTTLLSKFALTKLELENDIVELMSLIEVHKPDALVDRGHSIGESTQHALNLLKRAGLIQQLGDGVKAKYAIVTQSFLPAMYYANMAVHHFYHRAFIEVALTKVAPLPASQRHLAFWEEVMALRDLFKFEFFYSVKPQFSDEIERDLAFLEPRWREMLEDEDADVLDILRGQRTLVSQAILSTYVEAYRVIGRALQNLDLTERFDEKKILHASLFLGDEMHWQGRIHRIESVSKPLLVNGLRYAKNEGLIPTKEDNKELELQAFLKLLREVADALKTMQGLLMDMADKHTAVIPIEREIVPGSKTANVTAPILSGEKGSHIGAFFDLDRTIIHGFSAKEFYQKRILSGQMKPRELAAQFGGVIVYAMGNRNFAGMARMGAQGIKGIKEDVFIHVGEEVYEEHLADEIYPESRALVAAHLAMGHTVAIVSAATPYQVDPIARDLGVEHVMCTRMEIRKGKFTGNIVEPACWGEGKAKAAMKLTEKHDLDLSKSFFYTDSIEDLPLLELVGNPRPLNPDMDLSALAFQRNWPVLRFKDEPRPGAINIARAVLAFGSMIPAAALGVFSGAMSGSWRDGINSMIGNVGELGTRLAGIRLSVKGEENLWAQRPAVFIFNHQSNADVLIASKLIKKDVVAIAKKELKYTPVGPIFAAAGVIFIDRSDREKAIEAMKPAVDALKSGTSIAIAPEGTRSKDYRLGEFKKGAFYLAMGAGVPIVPIVIKNAHDVMPKGRMTIQPTVVQVSILPPVSTTGWTKQNLSKNIEKVRKLYLQELGQVLAIEGNGKKAKKFS